MSFIHDHSGRTWVYFIRTKYELFIWFKEFKSLLESQTSMKIKVLRTDNSGDFCSIEFDKKFKENGIERHKKKPYSH